MKSSRLQIILSLISLALLISLIIKLFKVPGGMILSGLFLGSIVIIGTLLGCLIIAVILKTFIKKQSFLTLYSVSTAICFLAFHYVLYSTNLKIVVPKGYIGEVNLVLSNVDKNILNLDSNGIGYINKWTFKKLYTKPIVIETDGSHINDRCVGFNPSTFWGKGESRSSENNIVIQSLSFEIVPKDKIGKKQYYHRDLTKLVDSKRILTK